MSLLGTGGATPNIKEESPKEFRLTFPLGIPPFLNVEKFVKFDKIKLI